jgi:hypothetical protein
MARPNFQRLLRGGGAGGGERRGNGQCGEAAQPRAAGGSLNASLGHELETSASLVARIDAEDTVICTYSFDSGL